MNEATQYKSVIYNGCAIETKNASICNLEDFMMGQFVPRAKYQVWSDKKKKSWLFHNIDDAVNKFLELKRGISK